MVIYHGRVAVGCAQSLDQAERASDAAAGGEVSSGGMPMVTEIDDAGWVVEAGRREHLVIRVDAGLPASKVVKLVEAVVVW